MEKKKVSKNPSVGGSQFPKIYRFITEEIEFFKKRSKIILFGFVFGVIFALLIISGVDLIENLSKKSSLDTQRNRLEAQVVYWQNFVSKQTGYRDGYFMLAVLEYQLKDFGKSRDYLSKALSLDPNFSPAKDLEKLLNRGVQ